MIDPGTDTTRYGFIWGKTHVERISAHKKAGQFLYIATDRDQMEIRITPGGRISVYDHSKIVKPKLDAEAEKE